MATIPNLNWARQTTVPSQSEFEENDQITGCVGCALDLDDNPAPTPPPGTIYMFRGSSLCLNHLIQEKQKLDRLGSTGRNLT